MMKYMVLSMLAVLGSAIMLSFFVAASAFAQDAPYSEKYMQQHDGGDRAEYLQEMESSDS
jgi:ABC-type glycerol-3-phosphate transport system substrate-binding protein